MGNRRNTLSNKLSGGTKRPGWQDTIAPSAPEEEIIEDDEPIVRKRTTKRTRKKKPSGSSLVRKTFLMTPDLLERIDVVVEEEQVGISELVRFLLMSSLDAIESGELEIPTTETKRTISM